MSCACERNFEACVDFLRDGARPSTSLMVSFIDTNRHDLGVEPICPMFQIAPSAYYSFKSRPVSARAARDVVLGAMIKVLFDANYGVYGARKMWKAMRRAGEDVGRDQVARIMRHMGLEGVRRGGKVFTTRADKHANRAPDLVDRQFTADHPNALWVTDLTYVPTWSGMAYVCFIVDVFSRTIVGWRVASNMRTDMVLDAVNMACFHRGARLDGLIFHSDAGSQGGFDWSSQHLETEVGNGTTAGMVGDADGETGDAIAGQAADPARHGAGVLGEDRRGVDERGRCDRLRGVGSGRVALVPRTWRHADHRDEPADRQISVVC